jgi:hypothetical protein
MTHTTEIVEWKQVNDGQFSVMVRCCGDASTDSWHTMAANVVTDDARRQESINAHLAFVSGNHEAALRAAVKLADLVGQKKTLE